MDPKLIAIIVNNVVVPELLAIFLRRLNAGEPLTIEDVTRDLHFDADKVIASGTTWLGNNPKTPPTP